MQFTTQHGSAESADGSILLDPDHAGIRADNLARALGLIVELATAEKAADVTVACADGVSVTAAYTAPGPPGEPRGRHRIGDDIAASCAATVSTDYRAPDPDAGPTEARWKITCPDWAYTETLQAWTQAAAEDAARWGSAPVNGRAAEEPGAALAEETVDGNRYSLVLVRGAAADPARLRRIGAGGRPIPAALPFIPGREPGRSSRVALAVQVEAAPDGKLAQARAPFDGGIGGAVDGILLQAKGFVLERGPEFIGTAAGSIDIGWATRRRLASWGMELAEEPGFLAPWRPGPENPDGPRPWRIDDAEKPPILVDESIQGACAEILKRTLAEGDQIPTARPDPDAAGYPAYKTLRRITEIRMVEIHEHAGGERTEFDLQSEWRKDRLEKVGKSRKTAGPRRISLRADVEIRNPAAEGDAETRSRPIDILLPAPAADAADAAALPLYGAVLSRRILKMNAAQLAALIERVYGAAESGDPGLKTHESLVAECAAAAEDGPGGRAARLWTVKDRMLRAAEGCIKPGETVTATIRYGSRGPTIQADYL